MTCPRSTAELLNGRAGIELSETHLSLKYKAGLSTP